jgi:hypothetical protein
VRPFLTVLMTALLTFCPILCGAEELGHGAQHRQEGTAETPSHHGPAECPEEVDNCICQGAVQAVDVRMPDAQIARLGLTPAFLPHTPLHPTAHLTREGSPTGLAGWGNAQAVRSVLQNFRC